MATLLVVGEEEDGFSVDVRIRLVPVDVRIRLVPVDCCDPAVQSGEEPVVVVGCLSNQDGGASPDGAVVLPGIDDTSTAFEEDGGAGSVTEFLEIHHIEFGHKNRCSTMPLPDQEDTNRRCRGCR
ncbi:hypothetical protein ACLOJK_017785 [Asimina triloba]